MSDRWTQAQGPGLNGNDYMLVAEYGIPPYPLKWDHEAIQWLQDHVHGTPVVAEAGSGLLNVPLYQWGSRISINQVCHDYQLGLAPQQRSIMPGWVIDRRLQDVAALYQTVDKYVAQNVLERYNVQYIVLGDLERATYAPEGLAKFDQMVAEGQLRIVFQNDGTTIYEVRR
jgi:uncharacterized membrane protein